MNPIISLKNISKEFHDDHRKKLAVLDDVFLEIRQGEIFVFLGPSGSGKSTLLRIMSGLEREYKGSVEFAAGIKRSDTSFVFQQFALLPWLTVAENIEVPLIARAVPENERKAKVAAEIERLGLKKFADSYTRELSGGMRQRVGIARALVTDPKIVFMDEPFSELDSFIAEELRKEVRAIWKERGLTVVLVTHIIEEAVELGSRIAVLTPRPGKIEAIIENTIPHPRQKRSPDFFALEDKLYSLVRP